MRTTRKEPLDLAAVRARLEETKGQGYWRSLEQVADTPEFQEFVNREFPENASELTDPFTRRTFLKVMGASLALAGVSGCSPVQPTEKIFPYAKPPEDMVAGKPLYFATAAPHAGFVTGVLVESNMGRPTKIEGNPDHPASLGATCAITQASLLGLYDPDRAQTVTRDGRFATWDSFLAMVENDRSKMRANAGAGFRVLTETVTSPTLASQLAALLEQLPSAKWHVYDSVDQHGAVEGSRMAFGVPVQTVYHFDKARVVLSLDGDFMGASAGAVRYARDFMSGRRLTAGEAKMNRLYVVEPTPTTTGAVADHRLRLRPSQFEAFTRAAASKLGVPTAAAATEHEKWLDAAVADLKAVGSAAVVVCGQYQPPIVHALVHAMNEVLGAVGTTVSYVPLVDPNPVDRMTSLAELVRDMAAGQVDTLLILGGNPVYAAPADLAFGAALERVRNRIYVGLYPDETARICQWHVPEAHYLESWSDGRAYDGTISLIQPLIAPLYEGRTYHEVLSAFTGQPGRSSFDTVRAYWQMRYAGADFEKWWQRSLHNGVVELPGMAVAGPAPGSAPDTSAPTHAPVPEFTVPPADGLARVRPAELPAQLRVNGAIFSQTSASAPVSKFEIVFRPDPTIWDGRYANNGWLQELPKPISQVTWDNVALISGTTAEAEHLTYNELVEITFGNRKMQAAVWILPGQADDTVTIYLGHGREHAGRVGNGPAQQNANRIRTSANPYYGTGARITSTGETYWIAATQAHHNIDTRGRDVYRSGTLAEYVSDPQFLAKRHGDGNHHSMLPKSFTYEGNKWGVSIDTNACIGCNACVVSCQAENNVPVVGKEQVLTYREMHWLRIDRYYDFQGTYQQDASERRLDDASVHFQPVPCMHCENAPCEIVCPVGATAHSAEGLNDMVYNRCVGTRYCSNNCPYKVRRFNFLHFADEAPLVQLMRNPDVTVRWRGVMEKCTYCVQRINEAKITAEIENRPVRDGEIQTACQQVCPTQAIQFGNLNDRESKVAKLQEHALNYSMLSALNTFPRTTYLARLTNPNPELKKA
jgi:molybdopterin-containing oxidoreductase family iron-sulfur binding subunit